MMPPGADLLTAVLRGYSVEEARIQRVHVGKHVGDGVIGRDIQMDVRVAEGEVGVKEKYGLLGLLAQCEREPDRDCGLPYSPLVRNTTMR